MPYFDTSGAAFNDKMRMLDITDPVHADVFNAAFRQLINNDVALMQAAGQFASNKNAQAEFLLNMHKTGKRYGVHFEDYGVSPTPIGTRLYDNVGKVCQPSTDTVRGTNDLDGESVFYHLEVNGYVDADGEFQVQYIKGMDNEFDNKTMDTWCLYLTQWIELSIDANGESKILSDTRQKGSFPEGGAIRPDGTIRPFVAIAKYLLSENDEGIASSISGRNPLHNMSHNSSLTKSRAKGSQYCSTTAQDWERMNNLFDVAFATRNSQSVMYGACNYYYQYKATVVENDVERIIIAKSQANNLVVGSIVSIGNSVTLNADGTTLNLDRGYAGMHAKANRVRITKIEEYDESNSAVYVDNGGVTFSTGSSVVSEIDSPTYISTMPWRTGTCDRVLGSCGSPTNNTNGKFPYVLFGVEMMLGMYEVCGNTVMKITNGVMRPYICYDCTLCVSAAPSDDYTAVGYTVALTDNAWSYIAVLGYDPDNPSVRHGTLVGATSSTGYCDGQHTGTVTETTNASREVLLGGSLINGSLAGRRLAHLGYALSTTTWGYAARLSASGRCAQAAA